MSPTGGATEIIDMAPGQIRLRGHPIEELIGRLTFPQMIWLMTRGEMPTEAQARLLEHALVAAVDHGPQAPSIAAARMAVTCGLGLNGAMANAVNMLDDVHGGAGEQAVELMGWIDAEVGEGTDLRTATAAMIDRWQTERTPSSPASATASTSPRTRAPHAFWRWWTRPPQPAPSAVASPPSGARSRPRSTPARAAPCR
jgi:citrate synthase